LTQESEPIMRG